MAKFKRILKHTWKGMAVLFLVVSVLCFTLINMNEKQDEAEGRAQLVKGKTINFDIRTYNHLAEGIAAVYDATTVWSDEIMLNDYLDMLDDEDMGVLVSDWAQRDSKSKKNWINDHLTVQRYASSTMYTVSYATEVTDENKEAIRAASDKMLNSYVEYAASMIRLTDENIEYKVVKDIDHEEAILPQNESKVNTLLHLAVSLVLGGLAALTYMGVKAVLMENRKKRRTSAKEEHV